MQSHEILFIASFKKKIFLNLSIKALTVHRMESLTLAAQPPGNLESHTTKQKKRQSYLTLQQQQKQQFFLKLVAYIAHVIVP